MTRKLMLWLTGATILFWIAAAAVGALVMREEFDEVFDSSLQEAAQRLIPLVESTIVQRESSADPWSVDGSSAEGTEYLTYQVRDSKGRILLRSHDAQSEPFAAPLKRGFHDTATNRIYTAEAASGGLFLQIADQLDHRNEAVREGALSLLIPLVFLIPLSMLAIWVLVRRALKPVDLLRSEIGSRGGGNLSPMTIAGLPPELEAIGASVNRLFERLRKALDAERAFASNSAHELRTPIAGALAQTQRLIAELPDGPLNARATQIERSLSSLAHLSEKLLQLARAETGIGLAVQLVDINTIVELVVEDFRRRPEYSRRLNLPDLSGSTMRRADVDALGIVLRNLIENALIHGESLAPVTIRVGKDGVISISNLGAVVPPEVLVLLTQRFRRGSTTTEGSGLGLAISDMLVRQMGGTLNLRSPASGRNDGFEATLDLAR